MICSGFFALLLLASSAIAESIPQTDQVMDRQYYEYEYSGFRPEEYADVYADDVYSDAYEGKKKDAVQERQYYYGWPISGDYGYDGCGTDYYYYYYYDWAKKTLSRAAKPSVPRVAEQEISAKKMRRIPLEEETNEVSMASTAQGSIFEKTEVLAVLIAGAAVGLVCSVFLIMVIVNRMKKKDEGSYNKAPTNEIYA